VVIGGTGGLGKVVVDWLKRNGAKNVIITGKRGVLPEWTDSYQSDDFRIECHACDVSDLEAMKTLFENITSPIGSIVHMAGILNDNTIFNQDWEKANQVLEPKVHGSWAILQLCKIYQPEYLLGFGSITSIYGSAGQAVYAAANAYLSAILKSEELEHTTVSTIIWGPWNSIGMTGQLNSEHIKQINKKGIGLIEYEQGIKALNNWGFQGIDKNDLIVAVMTNNEQQTSVNNIQGSSLLNDWLVAGEARDALVCEQVIDVVCSHLPSLNKNSITMDVSMYDAGLDSINAMSIHRELETGYNMKIDQNILFKNPKLNDLTKYIIESLNANRYKLERYSLEESEEGII
jgi:short-subunit dehydrogenase/acyl carrier protein